MRPPHGWDLWRWRLVLPFAPDHEVVTSAKAGRRSSR
jgi:hypothetical protein